MKRKAIFVFVVQIFITILFLIPASNIPQDNSIDSFVVDFPSLQDNYNVFCDRFKDEDIVIVGIELTESNYGNWKIAEDTLQKIVSEEGLQYHSFFNQIPDSLQFQLQREVQLQDIDKELLFPFIKKNFYNSFLLFDKNCNQEKVIANIIDKIVFFKHKQPEIQDIIIGGEPIVSYYLGLSSLEIRNKFFPALLLFCIFVMIVVFRSIKVMLAWIFSLVSSLALSMGIFGLSGHSLNLITNLIPILIFVLSTAMHMHILLSLTKFSSLRRGLLEKLMPNFLVTLTTSIGFASLMTSHVKPIYLLGKYTSISIWLIFLFCYLTHLGFSEIFSLKLYEKRITIPEISTKNLLAFAKGTFIFLLIPLCTIVVGVVSIINNPTQSNGLNYFPEKHPIRQNTKNLEKFISGASGIEILIPKENKTLNSKEYNKLIILEREILHLSNIRNLISLTQYIQFVRKSTIGFSNYDEDSLIIDEDETLSILKEEIMESNPKVFKNFVSDDYYRLQVICDSLSNDVYLTLKEKITHIYRKNNFSSDVIITGKLERIVQIQEYLLESLAWSLSITIFFAIILMTLFLKNIHVLYLSIIPNLFPLGCMASLLFVLDYSTTIGTVMVFSIAFGIAVDSTIHLFHCYCQNKSGDFASRWNNSIEMNATPIWITTWILFGAFLLIGMLSSFIPTSQFGILLAFGMIAAWIGDMCFLPISLKICKWL